VGRVIHGLIATAAGFTLNGEPVPVDIEARLEAEGYDLSALEGDIENYINGIRQ
jgi:hypothetical protein